MSETSAPDVPTPQPKPKTRSRRAYETLSVGSVGLEMGVAVLIGWGIGYLLDEQLGTEPYLMLVFLLFGVAAGFKGLIRAARQAKRIATESKGQDGRRDGDG